MQQVYVQAQKLTLDMTINACDGPAKIKSVQRFGDKVHVQAKAGRRHLKFKVYATETVPVLQ